MASRFISPPARPVRHERAPWRHPDPRSHPVDISAVLASLPSLPRPILSRLTLRIIERLDELDGDPDVEANGDEEDGIRSEDEFMDHGGFQGEWAGAGCPISDPDYAIDDEGEDDRDGDVWLNCCPPIAARHVVRSKGGGGRATSRRPRFV